MAIKPVIFSGPMVRALLADRKSQTRRVLDPQPRHGLCRCPHSPTGFAYRLADGKCACKPVPIRYQPGDLLWVRETWNLFLLSQDGEQAWPAKRIPKEDPRPDAVRCGQVVDFPVDGLPGYDGGKGPWRPGIHMPRWASRITLPVIETRVQRVRQISDDDAIAEGIYCNPIPGCRKCPWGIYGLPEFQSGFGSPRRAFRTLWDSINAKPRPRYERGPDGRRRIVAYDSFPWSGYDHGEAPRTETHRGKPHHITPNPWVAAYTFTVRRGNVDKLGELA